MELWRQNLLSAPCRMPKTANIAACDTPDHASEAGAKRYGTSLAQYCWIRAIACALVMAPTSASLRPTRLISW